MMTLKEYIKLYQYLKDENYSFSEVLHVMKKVDKLDKEIKNGLVSWLLYKTTPDLSVEGVSFIRLTKDDGMKPIRAFLMLDWIKREPVEAINYMREERHSISIRPNELTEEQIQQLKEAAEKLKERGVDVSFDEAPRPAEGTTDEQIVSQVVEKEGLSITEVEE